MALSENTIGRLVNWKFAQALSAVRSQTEVPTPEELTNILALADAFGNPGWFGGSLGNVVQMAVHDLIGDEE